MGNCHLIAQILHKKNTSLVIRDIKADWSDFESNLVYAFKRMCIIIEIAQLNHISLTKLYTHFLTKQTS